MRILIVEDEYAVREVIALCLRRDGHRVEIAVNGREGLEKFQNGEFDLVITDRVMPEMGGEKLICEIKKIAPNMPVILLSGTSDLMELPEEILPTVLVQKPLTLEELRASISAVFGNLNKKS